eukprot:COSAG01_NODE_30363_length_617_cov_1.096525_1_plen_48_part_10
MQRVGRGWGWEAAIGIRQVTGTQPATLRRWTDPAALVGIIVITPAIAG